jgi:hypothetical protein
MFRDSIVYHKLLHRFNEAMVGIKFKNGLFDIDLAITGGMEELMIASYSLMKYMRDYLRKMNCKFTEGHKIINIYNAIERALKAINVKHMCHPIADEADNMECVSRAAYAWLKSYNLLDGQSTKFLATEDDNLCEQVRRLKARPKLHRTLGPN